MSVNCSGPGFNISLLIVPVRRNGCLAELYELETVVVEKGLAIFTRGPEVDCL